MRRYILAGSLLLITEALLGTLVVTELPGYLQAGGWETRSLGLLLVFMDGVNSLLIAGAIFLYVLGFIRWRTH